MSAMDQIFISQLRLEALIGIYPEERLAPQPIALDIELTTDIQKAAQSDRLEDTIDYAALIQQIQNWVAKQRFHLIEALANDLADKLLHEYHVKKVRIKLYKFPLNLPVASAGISIERHKNPNKTQK